MRPKKLKDNKNSKKSFEDDEEEVSEDISLKKKLYPGLALPNNPDVRVSVFVDIKQNINMYLNTEGVPIFFQNL